MTTAIRKPVLLRPRHPERVCWGCDKFCPANDMACGNRTIRTLHSWELLGDAWLEGEPTGASDEGAIVITTVLVVPAV